MKYQHLKHVRLPLNYLNVSKSAIFIRDRTIAKRLGRDQFAITPEFVTTFLQLAKLGQGAISQYIQCADIFGRLQSASPNKLVWLYLNVADRSALAIANGDSTPIPISIVEQLIKALSDKIELSHINFDQSQTTFDAMRNMTINADSYVHGYDLGFRTNITHSGARQASIDALIKINQAHVPLISSHSSIRIPFQATVEDLANRIGNDFYYLIRGAAPIKIIEFIQKKINTAAITPSSLQEIYNFISQMRSEFSDQQIMNMLKNLKLHEILDDFGLISLGDKSSNWRRARGTDISRLTIFNIASEVKMLSYAGRWLLRTGDLEGYNVEFHDPLSQSISIIDSIL